jgi:hypothetical protein
MMQYTIFGILFIAIIVSFAIAPFGQAIEKVGPGALVTYYQIGPWKLNQRMLSEVEKVTIVQDSQRYFCITFEYDKGKKFIIQRWPTMDTASAMLTTFSDLLQSTNHSKPKAAKLKWTTRRNSS